MFKDRREAGARLASKLTGHLWRASPTAGQLAKKNVVVSLLRGGVAVGQQLAHALHVSHLPLAVSKIGAPHQEELALGAVAFDVTYTDPRIVTSLHLDKKTLKKQIDAARAKFVSYAKRFNLKEDAYDKLKNRVVIMTDDGVATGATVRAAYLFLKSKHPKKLILAVPVAPADFDPPPFDETVVLKTDPGFAAVSQYYKSFPQLSDEEVKKIVGNKISPI